MSHYCRAVEDERKLLEDAERIALGLPPLKWAVEDERKLLEDAERIALGLPPLK